MTLHLQGVNLDMDMDTKISRQVILSKRFISFTFLSILCYYKNKAQYISMKQSNGQKTTEIRYLKMHRANQWF